MFECLFLGDSIGVGTAQAVNMAYSRSCEVRAVEGADARQVLGWSLPPKAFGTVIISLGSNDTAGPELGLNLRTIRSRLNARRAIWLIPYGQAQARIVHDIAAAFGDEMLNLRRFPTRDGVHPESYTAVSAALLR